MYNYLGIIRLTVKLCGYMQVDRAYKVLPHTDSFWIDRGCCLFCFKNMPGGSISDDINRNSVDLHQIPTWWDYYGRSYSACGV